MILERRERLDALRLRFLLIGDGQKMPLVRETLAVPGAERYVRLAGLVPQREAPRYLAASDLLLSPHVANADGSRFFGSPTKLFEYMAMGRGIVASDLDQIGEVLRPALVVGGSRGRRPGTAGAVAVLVPPGDVRALIEGIELLAADATLRDTLGRNARRLALSRYTWAHHVAAILQGCSGWDCLAPGVNASPWRARRCCSSGWHSRSARRCAPYSSCGAQQFHCARRSWCFWSFTCSRRPSGRPSLRCP